MQSIHRVPPIAISITFLFLQLSESWEGGLMEKMIFACPQNLEMCLSIWQQNLTTETICSLCYIGPSKSSFFHLSQILWAMRNSFLLLLITWWLTSWIASLIVITQKATLSKIENETIWPYQSCTFFLWIFFLIKECLSNKIFLVLCTFWGLRSKMWKLPHKICTYL